MSLLEDKPFIEKDIDNLIKKYNEEVTIDEETGEIVVSGAPYWREPFVYVFPEKPGEKHTLVVNLFAGPGAGKSTAAAYIFSKLKMKFMDVEYVSEFAKDKTWENNNEVFKCQLYISGKQAFKVSRCIGKVDVIITDSPIVQGAIYANTETGNLEKAIIDEFNKYSNMNFFLNRKWPYNPVGRTQTEDEAKCKDIEIKAFLDKNLIPYKEIDGNVDGYDVIVDKVLNYFTDTDLIK